MPVEMRLTREGISYRLISPRVTEKPCGRVGREPRTEVRTEIRTSSDRLTSLEASVSYRLWLSLQSRMLAGLRACEHFGFRRAPTIHSFPA
jgi:hypothetical protein